TDDELAAVLGDPLNEVHVLHADGTPAGFVEFDRRGGGEGGSGQVGPPPGGNGGGGGEGVVGRGPRPGPGARPPGARGPNRPPGVFPNLPKAGFKAKKEGKGGREHRGEPVTLPVP